jgi:hypothetical protein
MQEMTPAQVRAANKFRVVGDFSGEPYRVQIALRRLKEISETGALADDRHEQREEGEDEGAA